MTVLWHKLSKSLKRLYSFVNMRFEKGCDMNKDNATAPPSRDFYVTHYTSLSLEGYRASLINIDRL